MEEKKFMIWFFVFVFFLMAVGFVSYFYLIKEGASQGMLTVIWGGVIFLFAFVGIIAISLVVRYLREKKNFGVACASN